LYIAEATPEAELYVGLQSGVTRPEFERKIQDGTVVDCFQRLAVRAGDAMFLPGGRVHAIGAGNVIFEIQQNSDTTYRVFDWNRLGLDGKPRELHVAQSLASIDFSDFEPSLIQSDWQPVTGGKCRLLVDDPLFKVDVFEVPSGNSLLLQQSALVIIGLLIGQLVISNENHSVELMPGQFALLPASLKAATLRAKAAVKILHVQTG
jgi:mannose-6-phosphate isomerase